MKIFLSSTCYDLKDLRAEVEAFLINKGHELLLSDRENFPVTLDVHRHDVCINNVSKCDLLILVVDSRFGAPYYKNNDISITWAEFNAALNAGKKIMPFVRREIFNERRTCNHNLKLGNNFSPAFAEDIRVFKLIDEIQKHEGGYWIEQFDNSINIKSRLENLYETNHSFLNTEEKSYKAIYDPGNIPVSAISGSTATFIKKYVTQDTSLNSEIIDKAIKMLPEKLSTWGEVLGFESIPVSNDYYNFIPLKNTGDEGEVLVGMSPTALGDAVRKELLDVNRNVKK